MTGEFNQNDLLMDFEEFIEEDDEAGEVDASDESSPTTL